MSVANSSDKKFYDESVGELSLDGLQAHCDVVRKYLAAFDSRLRALGEGRKMSLLELGAGSCVTSLLLSNRDDVGQIVCLDISLKKMQEVFPTSIKAVGTSEPEKISMVEGHFDARLPTADASVDVVVFDGALHHARSMWFILEECRRVLRPGGVLVAQREQYLGVLTASIKLSRLLETPEVKAGVAENAYLRSQYEYYLRAVGFDAVEFLPVAETGFQTAVSFLNGLLFSKWVIWARSSPQAAA